jgi:hypothetical protein
MWTICPHLLPLAEDEHGRARLNFAVVQERDEARSALETAQAAAPVANGKRAADDEDIAQPAKKVCQPLYCSPPGAVAAHGQWWHIRCHWSVLLIYSVGLAGKGGHHR